MEGERRKAKAKERRKVEGGRRKSGKSKIVRLGKAQKRSWRAEPTFASREGAARGLVLEEADHHLVGVVGLREGRERERRVGAGVKR